MANEYKMCECGNGFTTTTGSSLCHKCRKAHGQTTPSHRRRLRELNAPGSHTAAQWFARIEFQNSLCFWCFRSLIDEAKLFSGTKDHLVPLSRGGSDYIENIVAACFACNRDKGSRTGSEYREALAQRGERFSEVSALTALTTRTNPCSQKLGLSTAPLEVREAVFVLGQTKRMPESVRDNARLEVLKHQAEAKLRIEAAPMVFQGIDPTERRAQLKAQAEAIQQRRQA